MGARFFGLIGRYSVSLLYIDQWDFFGPFFHHDPGFAELFFRQHGPHREGLGLIADKFLLPWTDWSTRGDSFLIGGCIFAAMLAALLLKRRLFGAWSYFDVAIPLLFLTLAQFETLVAAPNPGYAGIPLLLIMLYCLVLLQPNWRLRYPLLLLLDFFLIYTGFGIFMGVVTLGVLGLEYYWCFRGKKRVPAPVAVAGLLMAAALLGSFFVNYNFTSSVGCFAPGEANPISYPRFMVVMYGAFLVRRTSWHALEVLGGVIFPAAAAVVCWHLPRLVQHLSEGHLVGAVLLGYGLLYSASAAFGRVCLGIQAGADSRYVTLMIPAFLALYFFLLSTPRTRVVLLTTAVFLCMVAFSAIPLPAAMHPGSLLWFYEGKRAWAECYARTSNLQYCNDSTGFRVHPDPVATGLQQKLDFLEGHRLNLFSGRRREPVR